MTDDQENLPEYAGLNTKYLTRGLYVCMKLEITISIMKKTSQMLLYSSNYLQ